jgi:hypothetical protein
VTASDQRLAGIERQLAALAAAVENMRKDHVLRGLFIDAVEERAEARGFERGRGAARPGPSRGRGAARSPHGSHLRVVSGGAR